MSTILWKIAGLDANPKGNHLVALTIGRHEARLWAVFFSDLYLIETAAHIEHGEEPFPFDRAQDISSTRERLLRDADVLVDLPIVAA